MIERKIEIKRNLIETFLMRMKDVFIKNKKTIIYSFISIIIILILIVSGTMYIKSREKNDIKELELIIDKYYSIETNKEKNIQKTIDEINNLVNKSIWGYVNDNGYYIIAGLYFSANNYNEGKNYFLKFVDKSPSSFFAPLALQRAGIAYEKLKDNNKAIEVYQRLENDYKGCSVSDEIYYNLGRMYHSKGNMSKAREYYQKVISDYPASLFASKAKKRILLLSYQSKQANNLKN
ncbi:MAG: tetratricopeptide repeat protein [Spirochaetota bacterium]